MYLKEIGKNRSPYNISSNGVDGIAAAFNWREAWVVHYNTCSSSAIYLFCHSCHSSLLKLLDVQNVRFQKHLVSVMVGLKINHCKWSRLQTVTVMPIYGEMSDKWWVPWGNPWCNVTKYTHVRILCYLCSQFLPHNNMRWLNQYLRERCNDVTMGSAKSATVSPVISPLGNGWCKVVSAASHQHSRKMVVVWVGRSL